MVTRRASKVDGYNENDENEKMPPPTEDMTVKAEAEKQPRVAGCCY